MWTRADLTTLKGLDIMRRRPEIYMPEGISAPGISARITSDALRLGARHVQTDVIGAWYIVSSDLDWLTAPVYEPASVPELFQRLVNFSEGGLNAARAEAWVGAYCRTAYAVAKDERICVVGSESMPSQVEAALLPNGLVRSVAFLLHDS